MTKRITALLLSVLLCLSLTGTAFAAGESSAIRAGAGSNQVTLELKDLGSKATYYMCSLLVKENEEAPESAFTIVKTFNFRTQEDGTFTKTYNDSTIPTLAAGNVLRLRVPGVDFGGDDYIEYTIPEEKGEVTITFNANGGAFKDPGDPTRTIASGAALGELPKVVRAGYRLTGWTDEAGKAVTAETTFTADATVTAQWEEVGPVTAVTLPKTLSVKVGKTGTLTAVLTPEDGAYIGIEWASSDTSVATVAADKDNAAQAAVKGVKAGTATITVTVHLGEDKTLSASCEVTVSKTTSGGGGGGGGGSSTSGDYSIGVNRTSNGSVSVNPTRADEGDTVTVTVRPHKGYELDKLTVKDEDGKTIRVTDAGDGKYTFTMPDGKVTVEATFKAVAAEPEAVTTAPSFNDVPAGFWAYSQITWAAEKGIMGGYGSGVFAPNRSTTRQALWMVLARLNGAAPADMAAARAWAVQSGVSDGSNPTASMSRQQMVTMLYRYAQQKGYDTSARADLGQFPDNANVAGYAKEALSWAVASGVMGGTSSGTLNPGGTASRAHFAVFMHRFCTLYQIA